VATNNRKFREFIDRFAADSVSTKVRSLMWECWVAATEAVENAARHYTKDSPVNNQQANYAMRKALLLQLRKFGVCITRCQLSQVCPAQDREL